VSSAPGSKSLGLPAELPTLPTASDETIDITPSVAKPRQKENAGKRLRAEDRSVAKPRRRAHHPLLFGVEEHLRKTRDVKDGELLRPYKRILPDLISSETALHRARSIANDLYLALGEQGTEYISLRPPMIFVASTSRNKKWSERIANTDATTQEASGLPSDRLSSFRHSANRARSRVNSLILSTLRSLRDPIGAKPDQAGFKNLAINTNCYAASSRVHLPCLCTTLRPIQNFDGVSFSNTCSGAQARSFQNTTFAPSIS
jgi:hypothetical protein